MITINDPEIQLRLQADYEAGSVPQWDPNDEEKAQAFVNYYNELLGVSNVVRLLPVVTYRYEIIPE